MPPERVSENCPRPRDFPGGLGVKTPPSKAGDMGSIPDGQLSLRTTRERRKTLMPQQRHCTLELRSDAAKQTNKYLKRKLFMTQLLYLLKQKE